MTDKTKNVQEEIKESAHKIWLAGLGALAAAEEEGAKMFNNLVERGEAYESRGREELAKVKDKVEGAFSKAESSWEKLGEPHRPGRGADQEGRSTEGQQGESQVASRGHRSR